AGGETQQTSVELGRTGAFRVGRVQVQVTVDLVLQDRARRERTGGTRQLVAQRRESLLRNLIPLQTTLNAEAQRIGEVIPKRAEQAQRVRRGAGQHLAAVEQADRDIGCILALVRERARQRLLREPV